MQWINAIRLWFHRRLQIGRSWFTQAIEKQIPSPADQSSPELDTPPRFEPFEVQALDDLLPAATTSAAVSGDHRPDERSLPGNHEPLVGVVPTEPATSETTQASNPVDTALAYYYAQVTNGILGDGSPDPSTDMLHNPADDGVVEITARLDPDTTSNNTTAVDDASFCRPMGTNAPIHDQTPTTNAEAVVDADGHGSNTSGAAVALTRPANVSDAPTGLPRVYGVTCVPETLFVDTNGIADQHTLGIFTYQWQRDDVDIVDSATRSYYDLTTADIGAKIRVIVRYADARGTLVELTSQASERIEPLPGSLLVAAPADLFCRTLDQVTLPEEQTNSLHESAAATNNHPPTVNQNHVSTLRVTDYDSRTMPMLLAPANSGLWTAPATLATLQAVLTQSPTLSLDTLIELLSQFEARPDLENALAEIEDALDDTFRTGERHAELRAQLSNGVTMSLPAGVVHWALQSGSLAFSIVPTTPPTMPSTISMWQSANALALPAYSGTWDNLFPPTDVGMNQPAGPDADRTAQDAHSVEGSNTFSGRFY